MKKLFISCPMRGLTNEEIEREREKIKAVAEAYIGEETEVVKIPAETIWQLKREAEENSETENAARIRMLGYSIVCMAEAEYFAYYESIKKGVYPGCAVELLAAESYGLKKIPVKMNLIEDQMLKEETKK